ncbi:MAG: DUF368 domain-containing protein [Marinobacter sp.]|nr:DUF368 domain-containing protein [Marinobacter sp.]
MTDRQTTQSPPDSASTPLSWRQALGILLRGVAMGAADIVPGVSGGTIAFITGIYFRLLEAINQVPAAFTRELCRGRVSVFWQRCDGNFLVALLSGILISVATLASAISQALIDYPVILWSFFFGLIVASVWHVVRTVREPALNLLIPMVIGAAFSWWVTTLSAGDITPTPLILFGSGALAICAMILPGISGSFILLVLGMYSHVLAAVKSFDLVSLGLFAAGCVAGLLSIARLLTWAIHRFHDRMLALLTGIMVGALNKVWPWKEVLSWRTNHAGHQVPLNEINVSPGHYAELTGASAQVLHAAIAAIIGLVLVLVIEWLAARLSRRAQQG